MVLLASVAVAVIVTLAGAVRLVPLVGAVMLTTGTIGSTTGCSLVEEGGG
jgi:hypothetical protein